MFRMLKRTATVFIAAEVAALGVMYYGWHKLNSSREFRKTIGERYPTILDSYYKVGETMNKQYKGREVDQKIWQAEKQQELASK